MPETESAWKTSSGLFDDFNAEIVESSFGTDARYNNGESTLLFWKVRPDFEVKDESGLIEVSFPVGGGWFSYDGGESIEHSEGKTTIHKNSLYGKVIDFAIESDLVNEFPEDSTPLQSNVWVGKAFHFQQTSLNYGGDIGKKERLLPDEWLKDGMPNGESTDSKDALEGYGDELKAIAEAADDAESFTEQAMTLTGITDHASLVMQIADGTLYESLN